jgi:hypothetical protein
MKHAKLQFCAWIVAKIVSIFCESVRGDACFVFNPASGVDSGTVHTPFVAVHARLLDGAVAGGGRRELPEGVFSSV